MSNYIMTVLKITPRAKALLKRFAKEDGRNMSREFEVLMEDLAAYRQLRQLQSSSNVSEQA